MPIYEYLCTDCERHFEKRQSVSDAPLTKCEECGGKLEKQWSLSGFQFKGEGWYVTDYSGKKAIGKGSEKNSGSESTASTDSASKTTSEASTTKASE